MAKKRKSENPGLDEVERTLYTTFCTAANSISQLYTQAQHQQKLAFQAGERHSAEKLYHWLDREYHAGSKLSVAEILNYLQSELDGEEMTMSPGPYQHPLSHQQLLSSNNQSQVNAISYPGLPNVGRAGVTVDQTKVSVFNSALSSPNRRSLLPFDLVQGVYGSISNVCNVGNGDRRLAGADHPHEDQAQEPLTSHQPQQCNSSPDSNQTHSTSLVYGYNHPLGQDRDSQGLGENDSSMDMHADDGSDSYYQ